MTLREYMNGLEGFVIKNPEALTLEVVYSTDDEGNSYHPVMFAPSIGEYTAQDYSFESGNDNAVCIN